LLWREHADDLVADRLQAGAEVEQDASGNPIVLSDQAEQDVFGLDVVVAPDERLAQGNPQNLLRTRCERDLTTASDFVAVADDAHDRRAHTVDRNAQALEYASSETLILAQQAEEDVLRPDVIVSECPRLVQGKNDHAPGPLREPFEHTTEVNLSCTAPAGQTRSRHPTHEAIYISDPDGNDVELMWDRPLDEWPRDEQGHLDGTFDSELDLNELLTGLRPR